MGDPESAKALKPTPLPVPRPQAGAEPLPTLDERGARVVLGGGDPLLGHPLAASAHSLSGPRGVAVTADGALWVADSGHHRLLGWPELPTRDQAPAQWVIGQRDFRQAQRNAGLEVHAHGLHVPTGLCACDDGLALADSWNHRVLIWHRAPRSSHQAPDVVLGQPHLRDARLNRGGEHPGPDTLYWPRGVYWDGARLWVADTGNRRVLRFDGLPERHGQAADGLIGQADFHRREEPAPGVRATRLRWPVAVGHWRGQLVVADAAGHRLLQWAGEPEAPLAPWRRLVGQAHPLQAEPNRGGFIPAADTLNRPEGLALLPGRAGQPERLLVADSGNSRLLRYDLPSALQAAAVIGQHGFGEQGDNRWQFPCRDSLSAPEGLAVADDLLLVADTGNHRVLLWPFAEPVAGVVHGGLTPAATGRR